LFYDNVIIDDKEARLFCDEMHTNFTKNKKGETELQKAECFRNVRTVSKTPATASGALANITSDYARLNYLNDEINFEQNVVITNGDSKVNCNMFNIYLADKKKQDSKAAKKEDLSAATRLGAAGKTLNRAEAIGDVIMRDPQAELSSDKVVMHFTEATGKDKDDALQSGGVRLTMAECFGNVKAISHAKGKSAASAKNPFASTGRILKAQRAKLDFNTDISEFHENVSVESGASKVTCEDMFVYSRRRAVEPATTTVSSQKTVAFEDDPDFDPYATLPAVSVVPSRVVSDDGGMELKRIVCSNNVILTHVNTADKQQQKAAGDTAEYIVSEQKVVVSSKPPRRSWLQGHGVRQECERIIYHLADERFESINVFDTVRNGDMPGF
jgi:lipopolysaccharide export system protein LptA